MYSISEKINIKNKAIISRDVFANREMEQIVILYFKCTNCHHQNKIEITPYESGFPILEIYEGEKVLSRKELLENKMLTDDIIRRQLGTEFEQLTMVLDNKADMYEYTNELAKWARQNGYNGLIVPGARGAKDYENVIIFEQSYLNQIFNGKTAIPIKK